MDRDAQILMADIRMDGVGFSTAEMTAPFCLAGVSGPVSLCYAVRGPGVWLQVEAPDRVLTPLEPGSVIGLSGVVDHWFKSSADRPVFAAPRLAPVPLSSASPPASETQLLIGHAPMEGLAFTNVIDGAVIIPPGGGPVARRIAQAIAGIEDELRDGEPMVGAPAVVRRLSEIILMNIARWVAGRSGDAMPSPLGGIEDVRVMRALSAAAKAPLDDWSVASLAAVAGMSRTAFAERFRALLGETPMRMVARLRLRLAAQALERGVPGLDEVAAAAGYGSAAAFIRAFRRSYADTPARWREDHRRTIDQSRRTQR